MSSRPVGKRLHASELTRLPITPVDALEHEDRPFSGSNALVKASTTAAGFLRSPLQKSKTNRNVNRSGRSSSERVRNGPGGGSTGTGTTCTGMSTSEAIASRDVVARNPELVEEPRGGAILGPEDVRLPEPDSNRVPVGEEARSRPRCANLTRSSALSETRLTSYGGFLGRDELERMLPTRVRSAVRDRRDREVGRAERPQGDGRTRPRPDSTSRNPTRFTPRLGRSRDPKWARRAPPTVTIDRSHAS